MKASSESDIVRLRHISQAIEETLRFIEGKTRADLDSNRMLFLALIKQLELIGEAASKISPELQTRFEEIPWQAMIATRHRLVHGYFDVDADIVWTTWDSDLRGLFPRIEKILTELEK